MISEPKPVQEREADWLRLMQAALTADFAQPGAEGLVRLVAQCVTDFPHFAERSRSDPLSWRVMKAAVAHQRERGLEAMDGPLLAWALDVADGTREQPKNPRGRDPVVHLGRDLAIVATVAALRDQGHRPVKAAYKEAGGDAFALVAEQAGISYETVARIWRRYRARFEAGKLI